MGESSRPGEWDIRLYTDVPAAQMLIRRFIINAPHDSPKPPSSNDSPSSYDTKEHYSFATAMIGICIHLDARYKQQVQAVA